MIICTYATKSKGTKTIYIEEVLGDCNGYCPAVTTLTQPLPNGIFQANGILESTSKIETGKTVSHKAGYQIFLDAGFEVELGANFEAVIQICIE